MPDVTMTSAAPAEQGLSADTESQATSPSPKEDGKPQETDNTQVEGTETPKPTSQDAGRPKPSDFYRDRKEIKQLRDMVSGLQKQIQDMAVKPTTPASVAQAPKTDERYTIKPGETFEDYSRRIHQEMKEEMKREILDKELPQYLSQSEQKREHERSEQGALELLFPKSGADDERTLDERVNADPEYAEKVRHLLIATKLNVLSATHPKEAAMLVLERLSAQKPAAPVIPKNPNAIKKALTGSTATGSPIAAGGKTMPTLAEIKTQLVTLDQQLEINPDLRYEDSFKQKRQELKNQLSALAKELGK